jgi:transposase
VHLLSDVMVSSQIRHPSAMIEFELTIKPEKTKMKITTIGLDIAKRVFHVVCCNKEGRLLKKKMLKRAEVLAFFHSHPECLVAIESCATSSYWAREIQRCGHEVKLIPPQHVKAFLVGNKNDYNDALAIAIAARQPHIRAVGIKSVEQQDNQAQHKARALAVGQRTALCNQIRGLVAEYGICVPQGVHTLRKHISIWLEDGNQQLSIQFKALLLQLNKQLHTLDSSIEVYDKAIMQYAKNNAICQRLLSVPGIGPMISSAYFNEVGNGRAYRKGRDVSASLGLVPKQHSSGGKDVLLGISKKGNRYLRCLLVQGAKAVVSRAKSKDDKLSLWINHLVFTGGHNRACVAYANKMARMAWAITVSGEEYSPV